jgi:glutamyl-tRNA reductase
MHLLLVGISHRTAPVEVRERLDFQARGVEGALRALTGRASVQEAVVLSTCNRAEVYAVCDATDAAGPEIVSFVAGFHELDVSDVRPHVYERTDLDAARHLFRVAAGLDSLVVGEPQILGQVKSAHAAGNTAQTVGPVLNRLFHSSFGAGKRVRTETALGAGAVSVSFAAVSLARKIFGELTGRTVLVIGAGEMGKLTAQHMRSQGAHRVTIVSRTLARAARTAEAIGGASAAPWDALDSALNASDIVITATGAAAPILTKARIETTMRSRRNRPLFIIDIAMPRDVEPAAGEIEQVFLYNIDDLRATVAENMARRASEIARAEAIVSEEIDKFGSWLRSRGVIPTVVALRQRFESIRKSELQRLDFKLSGLPPDARARVDEVTRLLVEKLLLTPTEHLKALADGDTAGTYAEVLTRVFGLQASSATSEVPSAQEDAAPRAAGARVEPFPSSARGPR